MRDARVSVPSAKMSKGRAIDRGNAAAARGTRCECVISQALERASRQLVAAVRWGAGAGRPHLRQCIAQSANRFAREFTSAAHRMTQACSVPRQRAAARSTGIDGGRA